MKFSLPKQIHYETAFSKAAGVLSAAEPGVITGRTGALFENNGYRLSYFDEPVTITLPEMSFSPATLPLMEKILILHYLTTWEDHPYRGEPVEFKNLPGGSFYQSTYRKRGPDLMLRLFGSAPETLLEAGLKLKGRKAEYGDVSVTIPVFPKIEATIVIHRGDDEFPPEAQILFQDDIIRFLSLEDVALLSSMLYIHLKGHYSPNPSG